MSEILELPDKNKQLIFLYALNLKELSQLNNGVNSGGIYLVADVPCSVACGKRLTTAISDRMAVTH